MKQLDTILFDRNAKRFYIKDPFLVDITDEIVDVIQRNTITAKLAASWLKNNGYIDENENWIK